MSNIKEIFEGWRTFLNGSNLNESIDEKTLERDAQDTENFLSFVQTEESARLLLPFIENQIAYFQDLKRLPLDSDEYIEASKGILKRKDQYSSVDDKIIDKYIERIIKVKEYLVEKFNLQDIHDANEFEDFDY
jgi:hypothetical protein